MDGAIIYAMWRRRGELRRLDIRIITSKLQHRAASLKVSGALRMFRGSSVYWGRAVKYLGRGGLEMATFCICGFRDWIFLYRSRRNV